MTIICAWVLQLCRPIWRDNLTSTTTRMKQDDVQLLRELSLRPMKEDYFSITAAKLISGVQKCSPQLRRVVDRVVFAHNLKHVAPHGRTCGAQYLSIDDR